jgi:polysaccharide transporter, PST family
MLITQVISGYFSRLRKSNFIKAGSIASLSTAFKIVSVFIITKYISVKFGPETLGLYGQAQSFINLILAFSTLSSAVGITKFLAEYSSQKILRTKIAMVAWDLTLICSAFVSVFIIIFSKSISGTIFFSEEHYLYVVAIGFSTFFLSAYKTRLAVLNGYFKFEKIAFWEIVFNVLNPVVLIGVSLISRNTVLVSLSISYFVLFYFMNPSFRLDPFKLISRYIRLKAVFRPLIKYSFLLLIQTAMGFGVEIILRLYLVEKLSLTDLGLYEGMNKISGGILLPISSIISIYFFPIFSNKSSGTFNAILGDAFKKLIPLLAVFLVVLYVFRIQIITLILSAKFVILGDYFYLQLVGLLISVMNLLYMNALLGRGLIKAVFAFTVSFSVIFLSLSYFLISSYGLAGAFYAYTITAFVGLMVYLFYHLFQNQKLIPL